MKKVDLDLLGMENMREVRGALKEGTVQVLENATVIPLLVGETRIGVIYLDYLVTDSQELELIQIFANQAAVAIQNTRLYQMATVDKLTGLYVRGFFEQCLIREVRAAFREGRDFSLLLLDLDDMKKINDTGGHQAGDKALAMLGGILLRHPDTDITCRYGGDEFAAILPHANAEGGRDAGRILEALANKQEIDGGYMPVRCASASAPSPSMPSP